MNNHDREKDNAARRSHRVIAALNREQVDFLDKLGKDALFSSGVKLSRTEILSAMVDILRKLRVSGEGLASRDGLEERILAAMKQSKGGKLHE
ncbi:MAG: hypothetical protein HY597_02630 [Candidatus Omnitrophica bacterium]|nr:hypothetical protein [Candidatus Omnitrophota bacterium]